MAEAFWAEFLKLEIELDELSGAIEKHPNSAWVAFDILRRDRKIREFLRTLSEK